MAQRMEKTRWLVFTALLGMAGLWFLDLHIRRDQEMQQAVQDYVSTLKQADARYKWVRLSRVQWELQDDDTWRVQFELRRGKKVIEPTQSEVDSRDLILAKDAAGWRVIASTKSSDTAAPQ